jgi:hypothetical protein
MPAAIGVATVTSNPEHVLVLGDIHANDAALAAVFSDARRRYPGRHLPVWFLGDLFGRGPQPAAAYRRLLGEQPEAMILGNHEGGLIGRYHSVLSGNHVSGNYNGPEWQVLLLHRRELHDQGYLQLDDNGKVTDGPVAEFIRVLPIICVPHPTIYLVHGGYDEPFEPLDNENLTPFFDRLVWDYVRNKTHAAYTLAAIQWVAKSGLARSEIATLNGNPAAPRLVLVGHYHHRIYYNSANADWQSPPLMDVPILIDDEDALILISPGSVGFPADSASDKDACYAILQLEGGVAQAVTFHKCSYDMDTVRKQMKRKRYPAEIIWRLHTPDEFASHSQISPQSLLIPSESHSTDDPNQVVEIDRRQDEAQ